MVYNVPFPKTANELYRDKISKSPRFPLGIQDATFGFAEKYCEDYKYPRGSPLSLGVDDTKLFSALRPLYDGIKQKWFIVGVIGDPIEVPDIEALHATLDQLDKNPPKMATKVSLLSNRSTDSSSYLFKAAPLDPPNPTSPSTATCHCNYAY